MYMVRRRVPLTLSIPIIAAFFSCVVARPLLWLLPGSTSTIIDCSRLIPKLVPVLNAFDRSDICSANSHLWQSFLAFVVIYSAGTSFAVISNFPNITLRPIYEAPFRETSLLAVFLLAPASFAIYQYIFGDLSLRFYGASATDYKYAVDYASVQIDILMYAVNILVFVPTIVILTLITHDGQN